MTSVGPGGSTTTVARTTRTFPLVNYLLIAANLGAFVWEWLLIQRLGGDATIAGYGLVVPSPGYDDYAKVDVTGKAVLIFSHEPQERDASSRFNGVPDRQNIIGGTPGKGGEGGGKSKPAGPVANRPTPAAPPPGGRGGRRRRCG